MGRGTQQKYIIDKTSILVLKVLVYQLGKSPTLEEKINVEQVISGMTNKHKRNVSNTHFNTYFLTYSI
jgi:hypothetical protein